MESTLEILVEFAVSCKRGYEGDGDSQKRFVEEDEETRQVHPWM